MCLNSSLQEVLQNIASRIRKSHKAAATRPRSSVARIRSTALALLALGLTAPLATFAQTLYWAPGSSGIGTWDSITANWSASQSGSPTVTWTSGDNAYFSANSVLGSSYTVTLSGTQTASSLTFASGVATLSSGTLALTGGSTVNNMVQGIINCPISGANGLTKLSAGELVLGAPNTFTGNLTNKDGTLTLNDPQAGGAGSIVINPTGPATLHSSQANITFANNLSLLGSSSTINVTADANNTITLNGVISGPHAWMATGPGTLVLGGTAGFNTFAGALTIAGGTVIVGKDQALGGTVNATVVNSGATLAFQGGFEYTADQGTKTVTLQGPGFGGGPALNNISGNNIFDGDITLMADSPIGSSAGSLTLNGPVTGSYTLTKVGPGEVDLTGTGDSYGNTVISQGTLGIFGPATTGTGNVTVGTAGVLAGNGTVPGTVNLSGTISPGDQPGTLDTGAETWNAGANFNWSINDATGAQGDDPGWSFLSISGSLTINATPANPFTVYITSLDEADNAGQPAANFDNTAVYTWTIATASGGITGFNPSAFVVNTSGFANALGNGAFIVQQSGNSILVQFVQKPLVTVTPANVTTNECDTVTFTANATGTPPLSYQWSYNSTPIPGATSSTYTLSDLTANQAGSYSVTVGNISGSTATSAGNLTVLSPSPVIQNVPTNIITTTGQGRSTCDQVVSWTPPTATDDCGITSVTSNYSPGATFPVNGGPTTVTYTFTDGRGRSNSASFTVTVLDTTPPVVLTKPVTVSLGANGAVSITPSQVDNNSTDNCGAITNRVLTPNTFSCTNLGPNTVTLIATDASGNMGSNTAIVTVVDTTPPTVLTTNITAALDAMGALTLTPAQVNAGSFDNCTITNLSVTPSNFVCANIGTNLVWLIATDESGNVASNSALVAVVDSTPPIVRTKDITIYLDATGQASIAPTDVDNGSTDNCSVSNRTVSPSTFNCLNVGPNTVTLTVTDPSGNSSSRTATVTVVDNIQPSVVFNSISVQLDATGNYILTPADVTAIAAGSSKVCGIVGNTVNPSSFTYCDVGTKQVTLTVHGANNNSASFTGNINVLAPTNSPATVYVDPNYTSGCQVSFPYANGSGAYFVGFNAFSTIQAGLNAVATNGTVLVAPGTYDGSVSLNMPVTLESIGGTNASNTIITCQVTQFWDWPVGVIINSSSTSVKGFTIVGQDSSQENTAASVDIMFEQAVVANIEIANNLIEVGAISVNDQYVGSDGFGFETTYPDYPNLPATLPSGAYVPGTSPIIPLADMINVHNNIFQPVDVPPAYDTPGAAFFINPAGNFRFVSNTIYGDLAQSTTSATNSIIAYNAVVGVATNDSSGAFATFGFPDPNVYGGHAVFADNSISDVASGITIYDSENVTITNNSLVADGVGVSVQDSGNSPVYPAGTTVHIFDNSLAGDAFGISNTSINSLPLAQSNWYGDLSGPYNASVNPYGVGVPVTTGLSIAPWLASGASTQPGVGFYPDNSLTNNPPTQLVFATQPVGADLDSPLTVQPVVQIEDAYGNVTPWANPDVTLALGVNTTGSVLAGTNPELAVAGIATFTDLEVTEAGDSNLVLIASAPYLSSATSTEFNITNPAPVITSITPFFVRAGSGDTTLTVNGSNFAADSTIYWNGVALVTTFVSPNQLQATIPGSDITSAGNVEITVGTPGPGGGATAQLPFYIKTAVPTVVYVDLNYTPLTANTWVNWPYTGTGTNIIGYDAFADIQDGLNAVASGGTVEVAAGTYVGELTISQPVNLFGPNTSINPNTGSRVPEAIILPDTSNPNIFDPDAVELVSIQSSNVKIRGFTIDGYNPSLPGAYRSGTNYFSAAVGIGDYTGDTGLRIENNIIKNDAYAGVDLESDGAGSPPPRDNHINRNRFENMDYNADGFGEGIILYNNDYAEIVQNTLLNVAIGISPQSFFLSNPGSPEVQNIESNYVSASLLGIWVNLVYGSASTFNVSDNTCEYMPTNGAPTYGPAEWDGIEITSIQDDASVSATDNAIQGPGSNVGYNTVGYNVWNTPTTVGNVLIQGGSVSNTTYGVWVNDYDGYLSAADELTAATISGVLISGSTGAGVYVQDDPLALGNGGYGVQATVTGNTVINNSAIGVLAQGPNAQASVLNNTASISGNNVGVLVDTGVALLANNDLTGNSVAGIEATNGAVVDAGDCGNNNVTGLGMSTGGNNLSGYLTGQALAIINGNPGGIPAVLAEQDNFGAMTPADSIPGALSGPVVYSQSPAVLSCPQSLNLDCVSDVLPGATTLSDFTSLGGYFSANSATVSYSDTSYPVGSGTITRTYMVTDDCGNVSTCQQTINVNDTVPPVISGTPMNIVVSTGPGRTSCDKVVTWTAPTATDTCALQSFTSDHQPGDLFSVGVTPVTYTAVDTSGNTATSSFTVTVVDTTPPVISSCPASRTLSVGPMCTVSLPDLRGEVVASDNCGVVFIAQSPAPGTVLGVGATPVVTFTVTDTASNTSVCTATITVNNTDPAPAVVYVDAAYAGLPGGTQVTWPAVNGSGPHYIGCDAFATIQTGADSVAEGGTVNVAAGTYAENLQIEQSAIFLGPNANVNPNTGTRVAEAKIVPATSDSDAFDDTYMITVNASQVTFNGFTLDGSNPLLSNTNVLRGVHLDAAEGIGNGDTVGSITVANNIVKNYSVAGIDFENYMDDKPTASNYLLNNQLDNIGLAPTNFPYGYGIGIIIYDNFYAEIGGNVITDVRVGIQTGNFYLANPGAVDNQLINDNTVSSTRRGIFHNLHYEGASPFTLSNNVVSPTNDPTVARWDGIMISSIQSAVTALATNNVVSSAPVTQLTVGYQIWNDNTTSGIVIGGGSVTGAQYGAWLNDYQGYGPSSAQPGLNQITISGVSISGSSLAGIYVQDDPSCLNLVTIDATVTGNTVINNSALGVLVQGTHAGASALNNAASITGNNVGVLVDTGVALLANNDLTGNSVAGIEATNGAVVDAGDCGNNNVTGLGTSTGGNNLSGYLTGPPFAIINANPNGMPAVLAEEDNFGASVGSAITSAFNDPYATTVYAQSPAIIAAPPNTSAVCPSDVPAGATTLADFITQGGYFSASSATVTYSDNPPYPYPTANGTITRTYTVTDACGEATPCTQLINVFNPNPPIFTSVPASITLNTDPGQCSKSGVAWTVSAVGYCGDAAAVVSTPASGSTFEVGITTVTNVATDDYGNTSVAYFTVTIIATNLPSITCPAPETIVADAVTAKAAIPNLTTSVTASDPCGGVTFNQIPPAGMVVGLGPTTVTVWAIDRYGNSNSCQTMVTVIYTNAPTLTCVPNTTVTVLQDKDPYATGYPTASSPDAPVSITYTDNDSGLTSCDLTGQILRTWTATDASGNAQSCTQTITVINTNAPWFVSLPSNITTTNDLGNCSAAVSFAPPVARSTVYFQGFENPNWVSSTNGQSLDWSDAESHVARVASAVGGITSPNGVAYAIVDSTVPAVGPAPGYHNSGASALQYINWNTAADSVTSPFADGYRVALEVYMNLNDPAVINATRTTGYGFDLDTGTMDTDGNFLQDFIFHTAAYDASGIYVAADYNWYNTAPNNRRTDLDTAYPNNYKITASGWYTFEFIFHDNGSGYVTADLNLRDSSHNVLFTQSLAATNPSNILTSVESGNPAYLAFDSIETDYLPIANAAYQRTVPATSTYASGAAFPIGTTTVTNTATDACGNTSNTSFTVTVNDVEPPTANVPANIVQPNDPNECGAVVSFTLPVQTDNCGISNEVATPLSGTFFNVGTTPVTVIVTDIHGNTATNTFTVTVNDTQPPSLTCPANIVQGVDPGQDYATVTFTPIASDNCGLASVVATPPSGSQFPVGTNTVTVVATDIHGNPSTCSFTVAVIPLATIVTQPVSVTTNATSTVNFSVVATSPAPLTYLWLKNGTNVLVNGGKISGATNSTLTITNVLGVDAGQYSVVISDLAGNVVSGNATLVVNDPYITLQPVGVTNSLGSPVLFSVTAIGTQPLSYQWQQDGYNLVGDANHLGVNSNRFTILSIADSDAGTYSVVVTNSAGVAVSQVVPLVVTHPPEIVSQPANLTLNQGQTATFQVTVDGATPFSYQWKQNGVPLANGANISGATGKELIIANVTAANAGAYTVVITNSDGATNGGPATLTVIVPPAIVTQPVGLTNNAGTTASFSVTATGTSPRYQWYLNATNPVVNGTNIFGSITTGATSNVLTISNVLGTNDGTYSVTLVNAAGTVTSSNAVLLVIDPVITNQPESLTVNLGAPAAFSVGAYGTTPAYQWQKNGANVPGATNTSFAIASAADSDRGSYTVIVSNQYGLMTSAPPAVLTVIDPPVITNEPQSMTINLGGDASFTVAAAGTTPFVYQWYQGATALQNGGNISGANSATLMLTGAMDADQASYYVVISNPAGMATSATVTLTVIDPAMIVTPPTSVTANAGTTATFTVVASGTSPSYQWMKNGVNIPGATSATLTLNNVQDPDAATYTVYVYNAAGNQTSPPVTLTVIDPPVITTQPLSLTNNAGTTASFTVVASGTSPSYQWMKNGGNIPGATSATLTLTDVQDVDAASYTVYVSNAAGNQTSQPATLSVVDPPVITAQPSSRTNLATTTATFTVTNTGTSPSFQWFLGTNLLANGGPISGATSNVLTITNVLAANQGNYSVVISNAAGVATSSKAFLTVIDPAIFAQPLGSTNVDGSTVTFSVTAAGTGKLSYQWLQDGQDVLGATNSTLTLTDIADDDAGTYTVIITNTVGSITSAPAILVTIPPLIVSQPDSMSVLVGYPANFSVSVNGAVGFSYQWLKNGTNIPGATNRVFSIGHAALTDAGNYQVQVINPFGSQLSDMAVLSVYATLPQPLITGVSRHGTTVMVSFTSVLGGTYNLLRTDLNGLTTPLSTWTVVGSPAAGTGYTLSVPDSDSENAGFYAVEGH